MPNKINRIDITRAVSEYFNTDPCANALNYISSLPEYVTVEELLSDHANKNLPIWTHELVKRTGTDSAFYKRYTGPIERIIALDAKASLFYARDVVKGRFRLAESVIASDASAAVRYAKAILDGPFPIAEYSISNNAKSSLEYALLLDERFHAGEYVVATSPTEAYYYAVKVLKGPFPAGEPAIYSDYEMLLRYKRFLRGLKNAN